MGRFRKIDTKIWNDKNFQGFTDDGKLAFLFLLTHPHMTAVGAMRATIPGLAAELGWNVKRFRTAIQAPLSKAMIEVNEHACYVALPKFLRYNEPEGPNSVTKAWPQALNLIPECPEKQTLLMRIREYLSGCSVAFKSAIGDAMRDAIGHAMWDGIADAKSKPSPIQEPEPDPEQESEGGPHACRSELTPEKIQERWNSISGVKPCKEIGKTIRDRIRTRVKEHSQPEWWDKLFRHVQASDFLCGRTNGKAGPFHASLEWVLRPTNLDKLLAGDYDSVASNGQGQSRTTCTKRIQRGRFLGLCGQPASPESRPNEPRCTEHITQAHCP